MLAEEAFPGIHGFYAELVEKPRTFLELVWCFVTRCECPAKPACQGAMAARGAGHR